MSARAVPDGPGHEAPAELRAWVGEILGSVRLRWVGWDHAESEVWRVEGGPPAYCKRFRAPRKYAAERAALERWAPKLPGTPRLLAELAGDAPALLITAVPGQLVDELELERPIQRRIHEVAGAWLAKLHGLVWEDRDPLPLGAARVRRARSWIGRARGLVDDELLRWVGRRAEELAALDGQARVPCHRDFSPRNWLWDGQALGVIDFEHAGADWWMQDLDRLRARWWRDADDLRDAFFRGYGREPSVEERGLAQAAAAVDALSTIVWAHAHADADFEREGWTRLRALRAEDLNRR